MSNDHGQKLAGKTAVITGGATAERQQVDPRFTSRIVAANGQRIHLVEAGQGPLVLFVHGFPEIWYSWRHQLSALADAGYRAVAVDQRGYGRSSKPPHIHDYRITELVADLVGVVEALGETSATVVGHDWGACVAWTAAWTRPEVFTSVVGLGAWGGRGLMCLPSSPFGERPQREVSRWIAGDGLIFYHEYFDIPGLMDAEFESDVRGWIEGALYSMSALPPAPPQLAGVNFAALSDEQIAEILRATPMCLRPGAKMRDKMLTPPPGALEAVFSREDIDHYVEAFERSGITGPLNYYRCLELDWELLGGYEGRPLQVPAQLIGGDRDIGTMWSQSAIRKLGTHAPHARPSVVLENCGHWIQQEQPQKVNSVLLQFLSGL
jgi:pimeloyl-ACP methyl ester carboxylesterase